MSYGFGLVRRHIGAESDGERALSFSVREDERDALRRCQAGDADAFSLIVNRYGDLLYGTAYLMLRDHSKAEEAVQDAFVAAWRAIGGFRVDSSLRPWLLRILVNQVLQRKRRKMLDLVPLPDFGLAIASTSAGPEVLAEQAWERDEVRSALDALPRSDSRIVILRFFAELSIAEVAEALDIPEGTVKSRLHRALQKLRRELLRRQGSHAKRNQPPKGGEQ